MASADLDHIRALLIAQTAEAEPKSRGVFGRLGARKRVQRQPLSLDLPTVRPPVETERCSEPDQRLLLEAICGSLDEQPNAAAAGAAVEVVSPPPRESFGRRGDAAAEIELMLVRPAAEPRRLRVLDSSGSAVGEMVLMPEEPPLRAIHPLADERHAAPYFPEDLMEPEAPRTPQPMRPWIKTLRQAGATCAPKPATVPEDAPLARQVRERRAVKATLTPKPIPPLGRDLMEALSLTLAREHDALSDRLMTVASEGLFRRETAVVSALGYEAVAGNSSKVVSYPNALARATRAATSACEG